MGRLLVRLVSATAVVLISFGVRVAPAMAAVVVWDGGGATNNWSEAANWLGDILPGATDIATFDGTSVKNATISAAVNVAGITINPGYTGTLTQAAGVNITLGASGFVQADGSFSGGTTTIDVNGPFSLTGGSFGSTSGTLFVLGNFTLGGGTFNAGTGTVTFDGAAATIDVPVSQAFNNLTFAPATAGAVKTIAVGDTLVVSGMLTLTEGNIDTGTVDAQGGVTHAATFDGGTGLLLISGAGTRTITLVAGGQLPAVTLNAPNVTLATSGAGTVTWDNAFALQAGTVNQGSVALTWNGPFSQTGGTFNGGTATIDLNNFYDLSAGIFSSTAGTLFVSGGFTPSAGAFNPGSGTVTY